MLDEKESMWLLDELNWKTEGNKVKTHIQFTENCVCVSAFKNRTQISEHSLYAACHFSPTS